MKAYLLTNWRTTLLGVGLLIVTAAHASQTGSVSQADITAVLAALGLGVASDGSAK